MHHRIKHAQASAGGSLLLPAKGVSPDQAGTRPHRLLCRCNVVQVLETLSHDFRSKRRERVLRLDVQPGARPAVAGLEELHSSLKEAVKATFEARAKAYDDEVLRCPCGVCTAFTCDGASSAGCRGSAGDTGGWV